MISLDIKSDAKTTSSSQLNLSSSDDEPTLSFSELLKGVSAKKDDKVIQNGSLILSLDSGEEVSSKDVKSTSKIDALLGLLKSDDNLVEVTEETVELNPKLVENLSTKDIKLLVADAKDYLKNKIQSSDEYKLSEVKELPKTLKGLAQIAKKLDIDVSKITIEEVQTKQPLDKLAKIESIPLKEITKEKEIKVKLKDIEVKLKESPIKDILHSKDTPKEVKLKTDKIHTTQVKAQSIEEDVEVKVQEPQIKEISKKITKQEVKTQTTLHVKENIPEKEIKTTNVDVDDVDMLKEQKNDDKYSKVVKELKSTPLFKAQDTAKTTSTEQIVQVKVSSGIDINIKTPKDRADETLKLLLRGEKPAIKEAGFTADFSVATAKVIAPSATTDVRKSIEALLHGDSNSAAKDVDGAPESISVNKADSFEVKLNEAKQMVKYLSSDIKSAIEDYKSPFTRVKVQLNPQQLGEVDLTIVQRGKNLHVNITSNNTAINTLAMNANDLKVQLTNNGINNASLNFNNSSQDGQNTQQGQQNRQNERQANEEYNYFDKEEANEEVLSSLEIIVPQYG